MWKSLLIGAGLALCAAASQAQAVIDCNGWQGGARNIAEPWEQNSTTFANGAIRVALLDTVEPAAAAFYLLVIHPPYDELGSPGCGIIGLDESMGFSSMDFGALSASYDPAAGLTLRVGVEIFEPDTGGFDPAILAVTVNQSTGDLSPRFEIP
ncbi:hypothetical protein [Psychromarinibacter sp. S121]|uniref:hypothetical protein n=1 Tax=Psychromarinibacter sp. S121 TaxID=3415127 RepID=UPI003C7A14CD